LTVLITESFSLSFSLSFCFHAQRSPPERTWSYKCINHRCVRQHYAGRDEKRTTFLTCSMLCGPQTLWPEPSIKSLIGTNANSFQLSDVRYKVQTPFKNVESLMESAFSVFVEELKQIVHASGGKTTDDVLRTSTRSYRDSSFSSSSTASTSHRRNLVNVNIYVNVIKTADVHLTLSTDECYNITMSSKQKASRCFRSTIVIKLVSFQMSSKQLTSKFRQTHSSVLAMDCQRSSS
jgi:beta-acetyl hexosaminidase like